MENRLDVNAVYQSLCDKVAKNNRVDPENYALYGVKRGLRNEDGSGVMAGLTRICNVHGYVISEGEKLPQNGRLIYRGLDIEDLVAGAAADRRFGFEEAAWLLLVGELPSPAQLRGFEALLSERRAMPPSFADDMILKSPSPDIMNKLARTVLSLYSYDDSPEDTGIDNVLRQSVGLIAMLPCLMAFAYQVKRRHYDGESMFFHQLPAGLSTAQAILHSIRPDSQYTEEEALLLDLCLMLHAEHGGGNNSTFAARVLTSSGTDTYSAMAAAIGSLKGPKHGGANIKVMEMLEHLKAGVSDWGDDGAVDAFLTKLVRREAGDRSGLIYGMGHAVYTLTDPRAVILKARARELAERKGYGTQFRLLEAVERLAPGVLEREKGQGKAICANVDLYSGLVYTSMGIHPDLYTPLFAVARMAGWCAHRIEELISGGRIMRPAYKPVEKERNYIPLGNRF